MPHGGQTIRDCLIDLMHESDEVDIAVGYVSQSSLEELDTLLAQCPNVKRLRLIMGMYRFDGISEKTLRLARTLDKRWQDAGRGEIRVATPFKYHGKIYCFYKDGKPYASVTGSANLSVFKPDADSLRQYEIAALTEEPSDVVPMAEHINRLGSEKCSKNIAEIKDIPINREHNTALDGQDKVTTLPSKDVEIYRKSKPKAFFRLPLKVPDYKNRHAESGHYTKSNINVCYAAPRTSGGKPRDWYETQITVPIKIRQQSGYPEQGQPFFVATDDGYFFKAHTTSQNNKQWSAVGDELIMGRWLKGRLAAAGLVTPVDNTQDDKDRSGMITQEMLDEYGASVLTFAKTGHQAWDDETEQSIDVWYLSFDPQEAGDEQGDDE